MLHPIKGISSVKWFCIQSRRSSRDRGNWDRKLILHSLFSLGESLKLKEIRNSNAMIEDHSEHISRRTLWKLYANRLISSWGDRMWSFAVGLFMIELSPGSLKWPAIYGLALSLSVVFCGSAVGRWVDKNQRWRGELSFVISLWCSIKRVENQQLTRSLFMNSGSNIFDYSQFFCGPVCSVRLSDFLFSHTAWRSRFDFS